MQGLKIQDLLYEKIQIHRNILALSELLPPNYNTLQKLNSLQIQGNDTLDTISKFEDFHLTGFYLYKSTKFGLHD